MRKQQSAAGAPDLDREPDVVLEVLAWVSELKQTAMVAEAYGDKPARPKLQREAKVRNPASGKEGIVPVVGTAGQFQFASSTRVEGYLSKDKKTLYVQPRIEEAGVEASDLV